MANKCIICGSYKNNIIFKESNINILRCNNCGHVFSSYNIDQNYDGYFGYQEIDNEEQFWWNKAHKKMYDHFCKYFISGKRGKLLDVGCGLGYFVKEVSKYNQWNVFGCEISKQAVKFATNKLGLNNILCGNLEKLCFDKSSFDIITLWDVLEHIPNPDPLLSYISSLLKKEGILFIHTPNIKIQLIKAKIKRLFFKKKKHSIHYLEARDHLNIYSSKTVTKILNRNGFNNVKFIHLKPIQSVSGSRRQLLIFIKNLWYYFSICLFYMTFGYINVDNLFLIAKK